MRGLEPKDIFDGIAYGIRKRKSTVVGAIPTTDDLVRELEELHTSADQKTALEIVDTSKKSRAEEYPSKIASQSVLDIKSEVGEVSEGTACIPCTNDHLSTCSGLLAEALRFARKDGIQSIEVISRVGLCNDELNAMERVDLRPELTVSLLQWEKQLANDALNGSRDLRHNMADVASVEDLENVAAKAQTLRRHIGESWLKGRIASMSQAE